MRRSQNSEEQIIAILREAEAGNAIRELCREHGITDQTYIDGKPSMAGWSCPRRGGCAFFIKPLQFTES